VYKRQPFALEDFNEEGDLMIWSSTPWLLCIGFTIIFSALFAKTRRVNLLIHSASRAASGNHKRQKGVNGRNKTVLSSVQDMLQPFFFLLFCNVLVLICWSVFDPLRYARKDGMGTDGWNRVIATYGVCRAEGSTTPYLVVLAVLNMTVLLVANYEAYKARNVMSDYSESKYIGIAVASMLQSALVGGPVMGLMQTQPLAFYLTACFMMFVVSLGILCLMFLPKILFSETSEAINTDARSAETKNGSNPHETQTTGQHSHRVLNAKPKLPTPTSSKLPPSHGIDDQGIDREPIGYPGGSSWAEMPSFSTVEGSEKANGDVCPPSSSWAEMPSFSVAEVEDQPDAVSSRKKYDTTLVDISENEELEGS